MRSTTLSTKCQYSTFKNLIYHFSYWIGLWILWGEIRPDWLNWQKRIAQSCRPDNEKVFIPSTPSQLIFVNIYVHIFIYLWTHPWKLRKEHRNFNVGTSSLVASARKKNLNKPASFPSFCFFSSASQRLSVVEMLSFHLFCTQVQFLLLSKNMKILQ